MGCCPSLSSSVKWTGGNVAAHLGWAPHCLNILASPLSVSGTCAAGDGGVSVPSGGRSWNSTSLTSSGSGLWWFQGWESWAPSAVQIWAHSLDSGTTESHLSQPPCLSFLSIFPLSPSFSHFRLLSPTLSASLSSYPKTWGHGDTHGLSLTRPKGICPSHRGTSGLSLRISRQRTLSLLPVFLHSGLLHRDVSPVTQAASLKFLLVLLSPFA